MRANAGRLYINKRVVPYTRPVPPCTCPSVHGFFLICGVQAVVPAVAETDSKEKKDGIELLVVQLTNYETLRTLDIQIDSLYCCVFIWLCVCLLYVYSRTVVVHDQALRQGQLPDQRL